MIKQPETLPVTSTGDCSSSRGSTSSSASPVHTPAYERLDDVPPAFSAEKLPNIKALQLRESVSTDDISDSESLARYLLLITLSLFR